MTSLATQESVKLSKIWNAEDLKIENWNLEWRISRRTPNSPLPTWGSHLGWSTVANWSASRQLGFLTKLCLFITICLHWSWKAPMGSGQLRIHLHLHLHLLVVFPTHFNPNNSPLILLQISLLFMRTSALIETPFLANQWAYFLRVVL